MSKKKWLWAIIPVVIVLIILGFLLFSHPSSKSSPFPVDMTTPFGTFELTKAEVGDSFPQGCTYTSDSPCFLADRDHDVVALNFQTKDSSDPFKYHNSFFDNAASAIITLPDGTKIAGDSGGDYDKQLYLVFFVPKSANDFVFTWYENNSIHFTR